MFRIPLLAALVALPLAGHAQTPEDLVTLDVLPGWQTADGTYMAGLRFTLAPGWKTYWRAPGEAGIPPLFQWSGSENIAGIGFHWPVPEVFHLNGMESIGYSGQVVIPVEITPATPGAPAHVAGNVEIGICSDICVPVTLRFAADVAPGERRDPAIAAALVDQPMSAERAEVGAVTCDAAPAGDMLHVTARIEMPAASADEVVVIEPGQPGLWVSEADEHRDGRWLTAEVEMRAPDGGPIALDRSQMRITVLGDGRAVDIRGCARG